MRIEFHPATVSDVNEIASYYRRVRHGLENDFLKETDATLTRIANNPLLYPIVEGQIRRCIIHRFPCSILFRIIDNEHIRILAIRHHKRHPGFGLMRT